MRPCCGNSTGRRASRSFSFEPLADRFPMNTFAFIIHPMELRRDAARKYPVLKYLPVRAVEMLAMRMGPKVMSRVTRIKSPTGAECEGWLLGCPLDPRLMLSLPPEEASDHTAEAGRPGAQPGAHA